MIGDLSWRYTVKDSRGRRLRRTHWRRSHSFLLAYLHHVRGIMTSVDAPGVVDRNGASLTIDVAGSVIFADVDAPASGTSQGISVGTGATPVAIDDFAHDAQIADGGGAGELNYAAMTVAAHEQGVGFSQVRMYRDFSNTNPAAVTVREVALQAVTGTSGGGSSQYFLVRDLVSPVQVVNNGETLLIEAAYRIQT